MDNYNKRLRNLIKNGKRHFFASKGRMLRIYDFGTGNIVMGEYPKLLNSKIIFRGDNNILFCESGVRIANSTITFNRNNALVYLSSNKNLYYLSLSVNNENVCYFGKDNYMNGVVNIVLSERKHFFIGNEGMFSFSVWIRNSDPHLIYDCETKRRMNITKSIFLGDHVWIGQSALILKGTKIESGSIVGAMSVVAGKYVHHNSIWAGNPSRKISDFVFWDKSSVHAFNREQTTRSQVYTEFLGDNHLYNRYIYDFDDSQCIMFETIDEKFDSTDVMKKLEYLKDLAKNTEKNRFVNR